MSATAKEITDRDRLTDHIADAMAENWRALTVDVLVTHPMDAAAMGIVAGLKAGRFTDRNRARKFADELADLAERYGPEVDVVHEICRCALNARKRGHLQKTGD